jgi:hypothetical protein
MSSVAPLVPQLTKEYGKLVLTVALTGNINTKVSEIRSICENM